MQASNFHQAPLKSTIATAALRVPSSSSYRREETSPVRSRMSPERLKAMKTTAMRAVVGRGRSVSNAQKMTCLCAPTNHPGSFRCRLHRGNSSSLSEQALRASKNIAEDDGSAENSSSKFAPVAPGQRKVLPPPRASPATASIRSRGSSPYVPRPTFKNHTSTGFSRGPSRLSKVVFASEVEEADQHHAEQSASTSDKFDIGPILQPSVRFLNISSKAPTAALGARFCALRRLQGAGRDNVFSMIRPTNPRLILSL